MATFEMVLEKALCIKETDDYTVLCLNYQSL